MKVIVVSGNDGQETSFQFPENESSARVHAELCVKLNLKPLRTRFFCIPNNDSDTSTGGEPCKEMCASHKRRLYIDPNAHNKPLSYYYSIQADSAALRLGVKDIGPQFSYRGVFLLEYTGPLLIWLLISYIIKPKTPFVALATAMWVFHYTKRLLESLFVHTFSNETMPLRNLIKNCVYYWGFATAIAWTVLQSNTRIEVNIRDKVDLWKEFLHQFEKTKDYSHILSLSKSVSAHLLHEVSIIPTVLFFVSELLNLYCHLKLRYLRPAGSKDHFLPRGFLFDQIACPNYTTEILSWLFFTIFTRSWVSALFNVCGACQMYVWARRKRARLVAEFPEAKGRSCIFIFL